ncbi:MAG TPA: hypothetical protein VN736_03145 [Candidatus Limnocylindrales bacterium]|nr:hypothetical protein [Candidatus Limnocylindrales bacterium]
MRAFVAALAFLGAALCGFAQPAPQDLVSTTVTNDRTGQATVTVHNHGKSDLVAFLYIYTLHRDPNGGTNYASTGYYDALTDPQYAKAIPAGQDFTLPFRVGGNGFYAKVAVGAGIFADGTTFGERVTLQHIFDRRNFMLVSLKKSIAELQQVGEDKLTREQIIVQFTKELNEEASLGLDPELTSCIQQVRGQILGVLRTTGRMPDGTPVPVQQTIDSLLLDLKHRRDILTGK